MRFFFDEVFVKVIYFKGVGEDFLVKFWSLVLLKFWGKFWVLCFVFWFGGLKGCVILLYGVKLLNLFKCVDGMRLWMLVRRFSFLGLFKYDFRVVIRFFIDL